MKVDVYSIVDNSILEQIELNDQIFNTEFNNDLVRQMITTYQNIGRSGTKKQKTRAEVSGGGSKPWRQKGTGRARAGSNRSPIWRKGGVTFAARPKSYEQKINKKMYRKAVSCVFSELLRTNRLTVVNNINIDDNKTKNFVTRMTKMKISSGYIVLGGIDEGTMRAISNAKNYFVSDTNTINPVKLIKHEKTLVTSEAVKKIEEWLGNAK